MSARERLTDPKSLRFLPDKETCHMLGVCACCGVPLLPVGRRVRHPLFGVGTVCSTFPQDHWNLPVKFKRNEASVVPRNQVKEC